VESGGCDFCRHAHNLRSGQAQGVSPSGGRGRLIQCPYCQSLHVDPADGLNVPYPVDNPSAARWMNWSPDDVLSAVRTTLSRSGDDSGWTFESAALDGDQVLVIFHGRDQSRYGVHYDLAEVPIGNNTGLLCETPARWADEISWTMDEQVLTGGLRRAERTGLTNGITMLRWVW
jgi:hypothetical protein